MTDDAALVQQTRDLVRIGDAALRIRGPVAADEASGDRRFRPGDRRSSKDRVERHREIVLCWLRAVIGGRFIGRDEPELVVDATPVAQQPLAVEDHDFRRPRRAKRIGDMLFQILGDGERNLVGPDKGGQFRMRILAIGVDAKKDDAFRLVLAGQLDQPRHVRLDQWALGAQERQDDDLVAANLGQRPRVAMHIAGRDAFNSAPIAGSGPGDADGLTGKRSTANVALGTKPDATKIPAQIRLRTSISCACGN